MITLWHAWSCPYCQRVRIALEEKGIPWERRDVDLSSKPRELYDLSPAGGVPVLVEEGRAVPDSLVILEYLEDRFPEPPLLPPDAAGRARVRLLWEAIRGGLAPALGQLARGAPDQRPAAEAAARRALEALERDAPEAGFWVGRFSNADVALAPFVLRLPEALRPARLGLPRLAAWTERVLARPSVAAGTATRP
jgi:glutathione S-transferase